MIAAVRKPQLEIIEKNSWMPYILGTLKAAEMGAAIRTLWKFNGLLSPHALGEILERLSRSVVLESKLGVLVFRGDCLNPRAIEDYGIVSRKVITTTGVGFLVDAWQNIVEMEIMKYHGLGTSSAGEVPGDTALTTELTTQYSTDNTRATGSLTEGASSVVFRTVGTVTVDAGVTIQEHGILSQAAVGGGVLWDRSLTGGNVLASGDSLQATYDMTGTAGG